MRFRKKPVVIDAVQWTGSNDADMDAFIGDATVWNTNGEFDDHLEILTLEGVHTANPGDWIIKGVKGEFYPCKPDIFEMTYEEAPEPPKEVK